MENENEGIVGCLTGIFELVGLFIVITWPILLLFMWGR